MQISHEMPLALLEKGFDLKYNDYFYALCHLFETEPSYLAYAKDQVKSGRKVLLDNSLFELKEAFDIDRFAYWVRELNPTEYILPDAWCDRTKTIQNAYKFVEKYSSLPGKKIGVVQGQTPEELISCYESIEPIVDKVAFSFDNPGFVSFYKKSHIRRVPRTMKWQDNMLGRQRLLLHMKKEGILNTKKPHHLLGCMLPQDFSFYKGKEWSCIESIDTSNPVVHGLLGIKYNAYGLDSKSEMKMVDMLHKIPTEDQLKLVEYNIKKFRDILK